MKEIDKQSFAICWELNDECWEFHIENSWYSPQSSYSEKCLTRKTLNKTDVTLFLDYTWPSQDYGHIIIFATDVFASCCCLYCALVLRYLRYIYSKIIKKKNSFIVLLIDRMYIFFLSDQKYIECNYLMNLLINYVRVC